MEFQAWNNRQNLARFESRSIFRKFNYYFLISFKLQIFIFTAFARRKQNLKQHKWSYTLDKKYGVNLYVYIFFRFYLSHDSWRIAKACTTAMKIKIVRKQKKKFGRNLIALYKTWARIQDSRSNIQTHSECNIKLERERASERVRER